MRRYYWLAVAFLALGTLACSQDGRPRLAAGQDAGVREPINDDSKIEIFFTYGSEKEDWVKDVTKEFNASGAKTASGKTISVVGFPMGSGECVDEILKEQRKTHLTSPASSAFIVLANAKGKEVVGPTKNLCLSPIVLAMWKPMAQKLGWPDKAIGWADVRKLATAEGGWRTLGAPQWGSFKLGHTHPDYSNSGLLSIMAEVYAATGKTSDLTAADVQKPETAQFLKDLERSVVHYGQSTGFFGKKMFKNGPGYLSAAVLYESMVVESYGGKYDLPFPVVCVYPKEGTFWSDHPVGIVNAAWVTPDHKEAAQKYIDFLRARPQQEKALKYGFRPGDEKIALAAPLDKAHGVDVKQPKTELQVPSADVISAAVKVWRANKKGCQVVLVLDTSGSMRQGGRLVNAKLGAKQFLSMLGDTDNVSIMSFSDQINWVCKDQSGKDREKLNSDIDGLFAEGETALYDAIEQAHQYLQANRKPGMTSAVVVLTDGEDNKSKKSLDELLKAVKIDYEKSPVRVFAIAYGEEASFKTLSSISDASEAKAYKGDPKTIKAVFLDIGTFF
jgi:Ca-activated chloride channel family protein